MFINLSKIKRLLNSTPFPPFFSDWICDEIQKFEIGVAVNFRAIHLLSYYRESFDFKIGSFPIAELIGSSTITIPMYPKLKEEEIDYVINSINSIININ